MFNVKQAYGMMRQNAVFAFLVAVLLSGRVGVWAAPGPEEAQPAKEGVEFFEKNVRPILVERCYECHSAQAKKVKGSLRLDSRQAVLKGGDNGPALVPGDVEKSQLIKAVRWTDPEFAMPPKEQLTRQQVEKLEQWVKMGAPDPRNEGAASAVVAAKTTDLAAGRTWWAFQPVNELPAPTVKQATWPRKKIDSFILRELESRQILPSGQADARTLIQRVYLDLIGLRPTFEQTEAFVKDPSPAAYEKIVEELLASPQYGERWGRYWLDVARYAEDNPTGEATTPPYPYAWRYRDWVIGAMNRDVPYNQFVTLQLAADLVSNAPRSDLAATSFIGAGPIYHKDGRLSKDVIENLYMDDWDERVDVVSRGVLGLTVACARCHDHKFDPISTKDYYAMAGVFSSTAAVPRPTMEVDPQTEARFVAAAQRLFYLSYVSNLLRGEPGSKPQEARVKVENFSAEMDQILSEMAGVLKGRPEMYNRLVQLGKKPDPYPGAKPTAPATQPAIAQAGGGGGGGDRRRRGGASLEPFYNSVYDAGVWVNGSDPDLTMVDMTPGRPHDLHVLPGGNVAKPGELAPRGFLSVLAKGDAAFHKGSGRLELAEKIFTDGAPLAARVIVNRVWGWHFAKPLVETPSDFGAQGEKPSNPQLLDDLAARFIANGWSLKWLHREIVLSAAYQQASHPRAEAVKVDPANRLLWRMNPRRMDVEAFRDCVLQSTGNLDLTVGGLSTDLDQPQNMRRTVYARISRGRLNNLLQLYGFPDATMHSPARELTITPLQQLFIMNSSFMRDQATALAMSVIRQPDASLKVKSLYRKVLSREPSERELALAMDFLSTGTVTDYAHALLSTNEVIFWP